MALRRHGQDDAGQGLLREFGFKLVSVSFSWSCAGTGKTMLAKAVASQVGADPSPPDRLPTALPPTEQTMLAKAGAGRVGSGRPAPIRVLPTDFGRTPAGVLCT